MPIPSRLLLPAFLACSLFGLAGCGERDRSAYATEADEPYYREGIALLKSGRRQEALTAFLKVIDRRGEDAAESHLEIGLLYQQHINDPLSAIYHFKKYLILRPNSPQAPLVRQRIDASIRDFARTLPAQPLENSAKRVDLIAALDKLKLENDQLKQQLAENKSAQEASALTVTTTPAVGITPVAPAKSGQLPALSFDPVPTVSTRPASPSSGAGLPSINLPTVSTRPPEAAKTKAGALKPVTPAKPATTPVAVAVGRKHIVQKGDTLMNLAQKYYKDRSKWRDIYAANRKGMKNQGDLHIGMELVIP